VWAKIIAQLDIKPGETYRTTVGDIEVEIHRPIDLPSPDVVVETPSRNVESSPSAQRIGHIGSARPYETL
jgi:hypothetical protein